jgi:TetR/AcrR family transcriptional regulator, regulator of autoinduction and epiphytic fitness
MAGSIEQSRVRRDSILDAAISVFGRYGFKKASVEDLARAAQLSKQGLYLYFPSKEAVFLAAMEKYLADGLTLVQQSLSMLDTPLLDRLVAAMDAWFGRHLVTFTPQSFDVIQTGDRLSGERIEKYKTEFHSQLARALSRSPDFKRAANVCTPEEIAQVLFQCGLTWKEGRYSRAEFRQKMRVCIRACCQLSADPVEE